MLDFEGMAKIRNIARSRRTSSAPPSSTSATRRSGATRASKARAGLAHVPTPRTRCWRVQHPHRVRPQIAADRVAIPRCWRRPRSTSTWWRGLRTRTGLVVETGSAREVHHFALLAGYGAGAVQPYLRLETLAHLADDAETAKQVRQALRQGDRQGPDEGDVQDGHLDLPVPAARRSSKPSASKRRRCRQVLHRHPSQVEGIGVFEVAGGSASACTAPRSATTRCCTTCSTPAASTLPHARRGAHVDAGRDRQLQHATRSGNLPTPTRPTPSLINDQSRRHATLRGLFELQAALTPVPLDEVEPARRSSSASPPARCRFGSISTEAHTTLAIAMNRIGGKSNTGEGGEDPERFTAHRGDQAVARSSARRIARRPQRRRQLRSAIKQVASAASASPPSTWSTPTRSRSRWPRAPSPARAASCRATRSPEYIGRLRHSTPGVGLISPPPHHDIYSIEGTSRSSSTTSRTPTRREHLGQAGVRGRRRHGRGGRGKAKADHVVIAGHDGGTGAPPSRSIARRHAVGDRASPRPSRPWCSTACAGACACRSTAR